MKKNNAIYRHRGFTIEEIVVKDYTKGEHNYLGDGFWNKYMVTTPDNNHFEFDYYKSAENFIHQVEQAYVPFDIYTNKGRKEFESAVKQVRGLLDDLYVSHHSLEPCTVNYSMVSQLQRVLLTLSKYNTLAMPLTSYFPETDKHHHTGCGKEKCPVHEYLDLIREDENHRN